MQVVKVIVKSLFYSQIFKPCKIHFTCKLKLQYMEALEFYNIKWLLCNNYNNNRFKVPDLHYLHCLQDLHHLNLTKLT